MRLTSSVLFQSFTDLLQSFFIVLRRLNGPSLFNKNVSFCCRFMSFHNEEQPNRKKHRWPKATPAKRRNAGSSLSQNCVECLTQKVLVTARFWFYLLPNAHYFVSTFASVWHHNNFILRQYIIYRVNDAKMQPRLNTVAARSLSPGSLVFPSPQKLTFLIFSFILDRKATEINLSVIRLLSATNVPLLKFKVIFYSAFFSIASK